MPQTKHQSDREVAKALDRTACKNRARHDLIASDRVQGTAVFNRAGRRMGVVRRFLVHKRSGKVEYAELEFGGFLGLGTDTHPIPWDLLEFDVDLVGYVVDLSTQQLSAAPRQSQASYREIDDAFSRDIRRHYGLDLVPQDRPRP